MARLARGEYLDPLNIQIVHTIQRCVRRTFLCGIDPVTGKDYNYRRKWVRDRLEFLASVFAVDCLTYTVMSNHIHLVLRSRPDIVRGWSDEMVARRWLRLFPRRRKPNGRPAEPSDVELNQILLDPSRVAELRKRLSDISWWMRCSAENIARQANKEDQVTGHFWEGRYKAQLLLDEASILACAMYVDLNPIRAAIAETPEKSQFTGAHDRIEDVKTSLKKSATKSKNQKTSPAKQLVPKRSKRWEQSGRRRRQSGWLSPIEIDEQSDPVGVHASGCGRRASLKGFLSISLARYLELLDWTGRQLRHDKRGAIPDELAPILKRLGIDSSGWCDLVKKFGRLFKRAAGSPESMAGEAERRGQSFMHAPGCSLLTID